MIIGLTARHCHLHFKLFRGSPGCAHVQSRTLLALHSMTHAGLAWVCSRTPFGIQAIVLTSRTQEVTESVVSFMVKVHFADPEIKVSYWHVPVG
jgi:hypothetical protein